MCLRAGFCDTGTRPDSPAKMSLNGWCSVLLNSVATTAIALVLPRISPGEKSPEEARIPPWIPGLGLGLIVLSLWRLFSADCSMETALHAIWLSALALAGTVLKWGLTILTSLGRSLHERSLLLALLFSPLGLIWGGRLFSESEQLALALFWFANGFVWQAVFDDGERLFSRQRPPGMEASVSGR